MNRVTGGIDAAPGQVCVKQAGTLDEALTTTPTTKVTTTVMTGAHAGA
jgi:hypothetical protein